DELDAAESWFMRQARGDWSATGAMRTLTYWYVLETDRVDLPAPGGTVQAVRVFPFPDDEFVTDANFLLSLNDYDVDNRGEWVRLVPGLTAGLMDLPTAVVQRLPRRWDKVEIDWTPAAGALSVP